MNIAILLGFITLLWERCNVLRLACLCLYACMYTYLKNPISMLHDIVCTCYLCPWHGVPLMTVQYVMHGLKSRRGRVPQNLCGDANTNCPQILSCFKISSTRLLAFNAVKSISTPFLLTEYYSLFFKSTSSTPTKSHFKWKIEHYSSEDTDKKPPYQSKKNSGRAFPRTLPIA